MGNENVHDHSAGQPHDAAKNTTILGFDSKSSQQDMENTIPTINDEGYVGVSYRLRAGSPIYDDSGNAYLHTFGAEQNTVVVYDCASADKLPSSNSFMGQGGNMLSASFARIGDRGGHFSGRITYAPVYCGEGSISGPVNPAVGDKEETFIECTSLNISYDVMGLVSISYTVVSNTPGMKIFGVVEGAGFSYSGFVTNASYNPLANSTWFETHVTIMAVTGGGGSAYSSISSTPAGGIAAPTNYPDWWKGYKK
jgi:hypothetical protein